MKLINNDMMIMTFLIAGTAFAENNGSEGSIPVHVSKPSTGQLESSRGELLRRENPWMSRSDWGWDPFQEMDRMHSRIRRLMEDSFFGDSQAPSTLGSGHQRPLFFNPLMNIGESPTEYVVTVDVPGVPKESLEVDELKNGLLKVTGRRESTEERSENKENFRYKLQEASNGEFQRTVQLPDDVDISSVNAEHKDGVLTIRIPRIEPQESESIKVAMQ